MRIIPVIVLVTIVFPGCEKSIDKPGLSIENISFRDVPGVTRDEINAIEALKKQYKYFSYGVIPSTEAFVNENGETSGFTVLFSEWLSTLFGIRFQPEFIRSPDILGVIQEGGVDFSGDLRVTEERRASYIATDPIALRSMKIIRKKGSEPISVIAEKRLPRYGFIRDSVSIDDVGL